MRGIRCLAGVLCVTALLCAGCGAAAGGGTAPSAAAGSSATHPAPHAASTAAPAGGVPLRLAYGAPAVVTLPLWAAYDGGFFRKYGFAPTKPEFINSSSAFAALVSGHADLVAVGGYPTALGVGSGAAVRAIAAFNRVASMVVVTRQRLSSPAGLKGLKAGGVGPASEPQIETELYLRKVGISPRSLVFVNSGLEARGLAAMKNNAIQVLAVMPPDDLVAQHEGFHVLAQMVPLGIPWIATTYDVSLTLLRQHPQRVERMAEALVAASQDLLQHPSFAKAEMRRYMKVTSPALLADGYAAFRSALAPDLMPSGAALRNVARVAASLNPSVGSASVLAKRFFASTVLGHLKSTGFFRKVAAGGQKTPAAS